MHFSKWLFGSLKWSTTYIKFESSAGHANAIYISMVVNLEHEMWKYEQWITEIRSDAFGCGKRNVAGNGKKPFYSLRWVSWGHGIHWTDCNEIPCSLACFEDFTKFLLLFFCKACNGQKCILIPLECRRKSDSLLFHGIIMVAILQGTLKNAIHWTRYSFLGRFLFTLFICVTIDTEAHRQLTIFKLVFPHFLMPTSTST